MAAGSWPACSPPPPLPVDAGLLQHRRRHAHGPPGGVADALPGAVRLGYPHELGLQPGEVLPGAQRGQLEFQVHPLLHELQLVQPVGLAQFRVDGLESSLDGIWRALPASLWLVGLQRVEIPPDHATLGSSDGQRRFVVVRHLGLATRLRGHTNSQADRNTKFKATTKWTMAGLYGGWMAVPIHRALGLTDDEAHDIERILDRPPNHLELAMFAVMWSEHCSYKSSRRHLSRLPTEAPWVLVGPGENAGVVDVGDGIAAAIRIESHNHPSAIEPYQGAATGAGGILRDIFTMGARPIALMDPLRFGSLDDARSRWIAEGVVSGISGYGNSVGVPTIGGETVFDETYAENPLVNVLCMGILPTERLVLGQATGVGNLAVLLGSSTGRDGIGGVSVLASAGFGDADADKRPSVQVGDPFEEKRLIEACLALLDAGLVVGIQDLGGAGLCCATSETASRGGVGMDVDITAVPRREEGMEAFEVMTSESQERMLAIVEPADLDEVLAICERWEVASTVIGRVTSGGRLRILDGWEGDVLADVPASSLHDAAPLYERPM